MAYTLDKKFSTGVAWQDRQHSTVMENMAELFDAIERGGGASEIHNLLSFLDDYVVVHFHDEEKAMSDCQYPGDLARDHMHDHTAFIVVLSRYKAELALDDSHEHIKVIGSSLKSWLEEHIHVMDKKLGVYLTETATD